MNRQPEETSFLSGLPGDSDTYGNYVSVLERLPEMKALYRERGWPQSVCEATFGDLELWANEHQENTGVFGISAHLLDWFNLHLHGEIVRLGRLQFNTDSIFGGYVKVFRNRTDGERCIICNGGLSIDADGLRSHDANGWFTTFAESAEKTEGNQVEKDGRIKREITNLPAAEWYHELAYGAPMINIHIPAGEPLTRESCIASLNQAVEFFAEHLPDFKWKGFYCHAWLLDPVLQELLPEDSKIIQFQKLGHLYPVGGETETIRRVFGNSGIKGTSNPNRMQKKLAEFISAGGVVHNGGMFIMKDEI
ncbi:MAG: acyltransferase domain-containing protein [Lentisphaerota bacterium]